MLTTRHQANNFIWWSAYLSKSSPEIIGEVQWQNSQVIKGLLSPTGWWSDKEEDEDVLY